MDDVANHPRLHRRGSVYYFRAKIPSDLLFHFAPAKERTLSLRTSNRREAMERVRVESVKFDQEMATARRVRDARPLTSLGQVEIDRICAIFLHRILDEDEDVRTNGSGDEELYLAVKKQVEAAGGIASFGDEEARRTNGMSDREFSKTGQTIEWAQDGLKEALARGNTQPVREDLDLLLEELGIKLDKASTDYKKLSLAILKTYVRAMDQLAQRQDGEVVDTPPKPAEFLVRPSGSDANNPPLSQIFEMYKAEKRQLSPKTIADFTPNIRRFIELHGDLRIRDITRQHCREFKEAMVRMPARMPTELAGLRLPAILDKIKDDSAVKRLSPKTVNEKALATLSAVLGWADAQGFRDDNPARGLKIKGGKFDAEARLPYSIDDLNKIFQFPIFTLDERPRAGAGEAAKWLPLLALFTGARLEELGQLRVDDVRQADGIWHLDLAAAAADQRLKNNVSKRRVPVHSALLALGLIEYFDERRAKGDTWLFPELKSARTQRTAAFSQWWGKYARKHGIRDRRKVFHSFRHTVKDAFREANVPKELFDAIQGHSSSDESGRYGRGYSLRRLSEAMEKLAYPGLKLPME